jgi:hypothetical protein
MDPRNPSGLLQLTKQVDSYVLPWRFLSYYEAVVAVVV